MHKEVKGLVLRTTDISESDRMLTVYTEEEGIISAYSRGSRSLKSRNMSATMQFCYSSFVLYERQDRLSVKESVLIESFFGLRDSIEGLALAGYICDVLSEVGTADPEPELLRLALNSLYAIANKRADIEKIKAVFEVRVSTILGFMPDITECASCGEREGDFYLDIMAGQALCRECYRKSERMQTTISGEHESHIISILSPSAKVAFNYAIYAPLERLFSFNIPEEDLHLFRSASESYLLNHLERGFKTLDFYNEVKR